MSILKIYGGQALQTILGEIVAPVHVAYQVIDGPEPDILAALNDLQQLTPHLFFTVHEGQAVEADRVVVRGQSGGEMVFVGPPLGTELAALVSAIVVAGRGDSGLSAQSRQALAGLPNSVHLEVFTTPT